jgi:hypothetical protein
MPIITIMFYRCVLPPVNPSPAKHWCIYRSQEPIVQNEMLCSMAFWCLIMKQIAACILTCTNSASRTAVRKVFAPNCDKYLLKQDSIISIVSTVYPWMCQHRNPWYTVILHIKQVKKSYLFWVNLWPCNPYLLCLSRLGSENNVDNHVLIAQISIRLNHTAGLIYCWVEIEGRWPGARPTV